MAVRSLPSAGKSARELVPELRKALQDNDENVRKEARAVLEKISSGEDGKRVGQ
jgi:HEAT repeat protein